MPTQFCAEHHFYKVITSRLFPYEGNTLYAHICQFTFVLFKGCVFERTNYDGQPRYDTTMNHGHHFYFEECKSICKGETAYQKNYYHKAGGKCEYISWESAGKWKPKCSLYSSFAQTHAYHRDSPGNLYKMTCNDSE